MSKEDANNRNLEFYVLTHLIEYLSNRYDKEDSNPEFIEDFKSGKDLGFISDIIAILLPLHPSLVRHLPKDWNMVEDLSGYVRDNCDISFSSPSNYNNKECVKNLATLLTEKQRQYKIVSETPSL